MLDALDASIIGPGLVEDANSSKVLAINHHSAVANKCIGGIYSSLQMFCTLMGLPAPVSKNIYTSHMDLKRDSC